MSKPLPQPELVVKSFFRTEYSHKNYPGSGYCEDQQRVQQLVRRTWHRFLWWTYSTDEVIDEEIVPSHVWIGLGALGFDSSNWRSKFAQYIK
jgi:hypothetical protein